MLQFCIQLVYHACWQSQQAHSRSGIDLVFIWDIMCHTGYVGRKTWGPFHKGFFHHVSNSIEILFCSHPSSSEVVVMKFYTWHDSCACSDMVPYNEVTRKPIFHRIWFTMEKLFVKWAPTFLISFMQYVVCLLALPWFYHTKLIISLPCHKYV